jgi:hypothetical protein
MRLVTILIGHLHKTYFTCVGVRDNFHVWAEHYPVTLKRGTRPSHLHVGLVPRLIGRLFFDLTCTLII